MQQLLDLKLMTQPSGLITFFRAAVHSLSARMKEARRDSAATQLISLTSRAVLLAMLGTASGFAQGRDAPQDFEKCKVIVDDQARLNCLKNLLPSAPSHSEDSTGNDLWKLVRTPNPKGGPDAVAITRTADTAQSDPDLAGLMIRCTEKPGLEVLLALVRPFPPRSKRDIVIASGATRSVLRAEASSTGTALILPIEAGVFTTGPWRALKELSVSISDPEAEIRGTIPLDGVAAAIAKLSASCPPG
jgi:hypothetical protein